MAWEKIADILTGGVAIGTNVTIKGWVRTRRDSKAGLSFVQAHDGTSFAPLQVVAPGDLENYESEVRHLSAVCPLPWLSTTSPSRARARGRRSS
jgi:asparaginyl-tRNA synthetase